MHARSTHVILRTLCVAGALAILQAGPVVAQVGAPTDDDFKDAPPQFRESLTGGRIKPDASELVRQDVKGAPPSKDPRDFNGMYNFLRTPQPKAGGGTPGGPPPAYGAAPEGGGPPKARPAGPPAGGGRASNVGARACLYSFPSLTSYSTTIVMNATSVIFLMEENHALRWARFADAHQANFTPSYSGDSIARWDGNTLVVDTIGVKAEGKTDTAHYIERAIKLPDGNIAIDRFQVGADGVQTPLEKVTLRWRPDLHYVEDICEDFGEAFGVNYK